MSTTTISTAEECKTRIQPWTISMTEPNKLYSKKEIAQAQFIAVCNKFTRNRNIYKLHPLSKTIVIQAFFAFASNIRDLEAMNSVGVPSVGNLFSRRSAPSGLSVQKHNELVQSHSALAFM